MTPGILLLAHGARDAAWSGPFEQARDRLLSRTPHVELAFLEFMPPNLIEAGQRLVAKGCTDVTVVPLFLGAGGHVRKDVPVLVSQLQQAHPAVQWRLAPAVGETPTVIEALAHAAWDLAQPHDAPPP